MVSWLGPATCLPSLESRYIDDNLDSINVYKYRSLIVNLIQNKLLVHRIGLGQVLGSVA